jgi:hypothetical protein
VNEAPIKLEIQQWLQEAGYFWLRLQSGKVKVRGGYMHLCPEGTADIVVFPANVTCWIETKKDDGKQRPAQLEFEAKAIAAGHKYILARSLDEVREFLGVRTI